MRIDIPSVVDLWVLAIPGRPDDIDEQLIGVEQCLLKGAFALNVARKGSVSEKLQTTVFHSPYEVTISEQATRELYGKPSPEDHNFLAILVSNLKDDDEHVLFEPLLHHFNISLYPNLSLTSFTHLIDHDATPICSSTPEGVFVHSVSKRAMNLIQSLDPSGQAVLNRAEAEIILPRRSILPGTPYIWETFEDEVNSFPIDLAQLSVEAMNGWFFHFQKGCFCLEGFPSLDDLLLMCKTVGIRVEFDQSVALGLTLIELNGQYATPIISIRNTLPPGIKNIVLAHEIGHAVMHFPILAMNGLVDLADNDLLVFDSRRKWLRAGDRGKWLAAFESLAEQLELEAFNYAADLLAPPLFRPHFEYGYQRLSLEKRWVESQRAKSSDDDVRVPMLNSGDQNSASGFSEYVRYLAERPRGRKPFGPDFVEITGTEDGDGFMPDFEYRLWRHFMEIWKRGYDISWNSEYAVIGAFLDGKKRESETSSLNQESGTMFGIISELVKSAAMPVRPPNWHNAQKYPLVLQSIKKIGELFKD